MVGEGGLVGEGVIVGERRLVGEGVIVGEGALVGEGRLAGACELVGPLHEPATNTTRTTSRCMRRETLLGRIGFGQMLRRDEERSGGSAVGLIEKGRREVSYAAKRRLPAWQP
jgi:carbonic anhydrase/acetyltransferase-like protein (isoleucine patch superfamily)